MSNVIYLDEVLVRLCGDFLVIFSSLWATAQITKVRRPDGGLYLALLLAPSTNSAYLGASWRLWKGFAFLRALSSCLQCLPPCFLLLSGR